MLLQVLGKASGQLFGISIGKHWLMNAVYILVIYDKFCRDPHDLNQVKRHRQNTKHRPFPTLFWLYSMLTFTGVKAETSGSDEHDFHGERETWVPWNLRPRHRFLMVCTDTRLPWRPRSVECVQWCNESSKSPGELNDPLCLWWYVVSHLFVYPSSHVHPCISAAVWIWYSDTEEYCNIPLLQSRL